MNKKGFVVPMIFLLLLGVAQAVSIGISPGRVEFPGLIQGGYAERTVKITTNTDDVLSGHFNLGGDTKDWISFGLNETTFRVSRNDPYILKIIVQPPNDVSNGNYSGSIEVVTDTIGDVEGRAGGIVKAAVTLMVGSEVSGEQVKSCIAGGFRFSDVELEFPFEFGLTVSNKGNVRISPRIALSIWDQERENLIYSQSLVADEVLPTTERTTIRSIPNNLDIGQYWANIEVEECEMSDVKTVSVVEKGGIIDKGELIGISNKAEAEVDETVEIVAKFTNKGSRGVASVFKGNIRLDDQIVTIIDTDEIIVPSGETTNFNVFFTPRESGRYVISGRVVYNKKLTFEKSSILNVVPREGEEKDFNILPLLMYLVIIVSILFVGRKILKERKRRRPF